MKTENDFTRHITNFNNLEKLKAIEEVTRCCSSQKWAHNLIERRPFNSLQDILTISETIWFDLSKNDWLEAFHGHAKIGDLDSLKKKYGNTKKWSEGEQKGVHQTQESILKELKELNESYEKKYDHIFIVCATGKSVEEMLEILKKRIKNSSFDELNNAAKEQNKITNLRLEKLLWEL
jgi:2-oxo-4-hydroxy-4-carboxy-5-ureidoimidazoline decarboxylase